MKRLTTLLLLLICLNGFAQRPLQFKNIISGTFQFIDLGYGFRYDRLIDNYSIYGAIAKGDYHLPAGGSVSHFKAATGASVKINPTYKNNPYFSVGIAYHEYWGIERIFNVSHKAFSPFSLEFGVSENIVRFNCGIRYDVFKNEAALDIGYLF